MRLDKNSLAVRENEVDIAVGSNASYVTIAYVKLNRGVTVEDLANREELRVGGRVAFAKYWSIYASTILDLTSAAEDPTTVQQRLLAGAAPHRHRL